MHGVFGVHGCLGDEVEAAHDLRVLELVAQLDQRENLAGHVAVLAPAADLVLQHIGQTGDFDALVALGAVVRGETYHFEIVANESARGVSGVQKVVKIFEYLTEEWFARPTQPQSDSAPSPQSDGQNSTLPTTN